MSHNEEKSGRVERNVLCYTHYRNQKDFFEDIKYVTWIAKPYGGRYP